MLVPKVRNLDLIVAGKLFLGEEKMKAYALTFLPCERRSDMEEEDVVM